MAFSFPFEFHFDFLYPQPFSSFLKIEAGVGSASIDLWAAGQVTKMKGSIEHNEIPKKISVAHNI
jgi:hypothetical protein